jgi:hypothetical protein
VAAPIMKSGKVVLAWLETVHQQSPKTNTLTKIDYA